LRRRCCTPARCARALAGLLLGAALALASQAHARSRDFIDETIVSLPFKPRELGLEFGVESRLDMDYRVQGWYAPELEYAPTPWWFLEGVVQGVTRGDGLELGGWILGTRVRLLPEERAFVDVTVHVEYEVETGVAKHPDYERILVPRVALTRHIGTWLDVTANLGAQSRLQPAPTTGFAYGFGARILGRQPLAAGIELAHEPAENSTRITPQLWIRLPGKSKLRLGGVYELEPLMYRFAARAIVEMEFD
jgi:hypothetical protein